MVCTATIYFLCNARCIKKCDNKLGMWSWISGVCKALLFLQSMFLLFTDGTIMRIGWSVRRRCSSGGRGSRSPSPGRLLSKEQKKKTLVVAFNTFLKVSWVFDCFLENISKIRGDSEIFAESFFAENFPLSKKGHPKNFAISFSFRDIQQKVYQKINSSTEFC